MNKNLFLIVFFLLGHCFSTILLAQAAGELGQPFIRNYSPKDYGADLQNWSIVQDERGVMYIANNLGVLEYDGVSWRLIQLPNKSIARSLAKDECGRIYVGGVGDFGYLAPDNRGQMRFVSLLPDVPLAERGFSDVWMIHVSKSGIYFHTAMRLFRWSESVEPIRIWKPATNFHIAFLVDSILYVRQWGKGLLKMEGDSLKLLAGSEIFANERVYVMLPFPGQPGKILIGTRTQGLFLYDGALFRSFKTEADEYLKANSLYWPGAVMPDSSIMLGTMTGGAVILDRAGGIRQKLDHAAGLPENSVIYIYQDREGSMWLALGNGIARLEIGSGFSFFDANRGLPSGASSIIRHQDVLYVCTGSGTFFHDSLTAKFKPISALATQCFEFLAVENHLLVCTFDGVYGITGGETKPIRRNLLNDFMSYSLLYSEHGSRLPGNSLRIFVTLSDGMACLRQQDGRWRDEGRMPDLPSELRGSVEATNGDLWLYSITNGIFRVRLPAGAALQEAGVERFGQQHGLPPGFVIARKVAGQVYFYTVDGMFRFDESRQTFITDTTFCVVSQGGSVETFTLLEDKQRRVWVCFGREPALGTPQHDGTYKWLKAPFLRFSDERIATIYPEENGIIWFGAGSVLIRYDSKKAVNYAKDYPALIRRVLTTGDSLIYGGTPLAEDAENPSAGDFPIFDYSHNTVRFEFAAPSFADVSRNQYQTWLEGFDEHWSNWNSKTDKEYTNLSEGDYHFHVRAKNAYEHESSEAIFSFRILPPWYRSWLAYVCYAILFGLLVLGIRLYEIRKQREKAENRRRMRELEDARQLQLSMLPKEVPQLPHLDIAAYMKPSAEVGGDYYDFYLDNEGTLTVAIGDATGHGLKAGTMVTATKSLFTSLAREQDILHIMGRCSQTLKSMHLSGLYMAMLIVKIKDSRMTVGGAGMPPLLIHRAATKQVEEMTLKGMPLGGVAGLPYQLQEITLAPGDVVVLMSDGFPERFNKKREILDYEKAKSVLAEVAHRSSGEIIDHFVQVGEAWADGRAQNDDVTFVVLKVRVGREEASIAS